MTLTWPQQAYQWKISDYVIKISKVDTHLASVSSADTTAIHFSANAWIISYCKVDYWKRFKVGHFRCCSLSL